MLPLFAERVGLLVIDEAHCISRLGARLPARLPAHRRTCSSALPAGVAVLCTTATANDRVVADVARAAALGHAGALRTYRGPLSRASLRLEVVELPAPADRLAWLATHLPELPGSGSSTRSPSATPTWSPSSSTRAGSPPRRIPARSTTARADRRRGAAAAQRAQGRRRHERAGHGLRQARPRLRRPLPGARLGHLLLPAGRPRGPRDRARRRRPACAAPRTAGSRTSSSSRRSRRRSASIGVLEALDDGGATTNELMSAVNLGKGRLEAMLKVLDVEGAVAKHGHALGAHRLRLGLRRASATRTSPRCAGASRRRWRSSAPTGAA